MGKIKFVGKSLLIEAAVSRRSTENSKTERVLVIGDLHLGYGESLRNSGIMIPVKTYAVVLRDLNQIFDCVGNVNRVVLLGDVKHAFGAIWRDEWDEVLGLLDYLKNKCEEIVVVRGNHDIFTGFVTKKKGIKLVDYYLWEEFCFLHGDRDFKEIYSRKTKVWVLGHLHPAVVLRDGAKSEKYKCFLAGKFRGRRVFILPSFFPVREGNDVGENSYDLPWKFALSKFEVYVVERDLETLNFGKLGQMR